MTQTEIQTFTIKEHASLPQIFAQLTPFLTSISDNFLIMSRETLRKQDFFGDEQVSKIFVIDLNVLGQRSVELDQPEEEMKQQQ